MRTDKTALLTYCQMIMAEVLIKSDIKHADSDWIDETFMENMNHAEDHLNIFYNNDFQNMEELRHAFCRLGMALYKARLETENVG